MSLPLTPAEQRDLILSVSTHRGERRLSPTEVARLFRRAMDQGASAAICAETVGLRDSTMVRRFLRLLELSPDQQELVGWGSTETSVSFTAAAEIARLPAEAREYLMREALSTGLKSSELKAVVQRLQRSDRTPEQAVEEALRMRPRVERRHVFVGRFDDRQRPSSLLERAEKERDRSFGDLVVRAYGAAPLATRLTHSGFVITADDELASRIYDDGDFEATIIEALRASE